MEDAQILLVLAEFFLDELSSDPGGVADWLAQGEDIDVEELILCCKQIVSTPA